MVPPRWISSLRLPCEVRCFCRWFFHGISLPPSPPLKVIFHLLLVWGRCSWFLLVGLLFASQRLLGPWGCVSHLFMVKKGIAWGVHRSNGTSCCRWAQNLEVLSSNRKSVESVLLELLHGWRSTRNCLVRLAATSQQYFFSHNKSAPATNRQPASITFLLQPTTNRTSPIRFML